jgi:hypothetical protein
MRRIWSGYQVLGRRREPLRTMPRLSYRVGTPWRARRSPMRPGVTPARSHSLMRRHQATSSGTRTWRPSTRAKPNDAMPPFLRPSTCASLVRGRHGAPLVWTESHGSQPGVSGTTPRRNGRPGPSYAVSPAARARPRSRRRSHGLGSGRPRSTPGRGAALPRRTPARPRSGGRHLEACRCPGAGRHSARGSPGPARRR